MTSRIVSLLACCLCIAAAPSAAAAQCARCDDSWFGGDVCKHCTGGASCGESCKFDSYGNCYMPIACGTDHQTTSLPLILLERGVTELPAMMTLAGADAIRVEEIGAGLLVAWTCQGEAERVWRVEGARLLELSGEQAALELIRARPGPYPALLAN